MECRSQLLRIHAVDVDFSYVNQECGALGGEPLGAFALGLRRLRFRTLWQDYSFCLRGKSCVNAQKIC